MPIASPDDGAAGAEQRYNPFELALYADWFEDRGGTLTAVEIESGDLDAYVEGRIVRRLPADPPVTKALPAIAILGRVDLHIVRTILALPDATGDRVFRTLSEQEWTGTRAAEESGVTVLEVQPTVLRRLEAYFDRPERTYVRDASPPEASPRASQAAGTTSARRGGGGARRRGDADPAFCRRTLLWDELVRRIRRHGEWAWAASACARLLAEDGNGKTAHPVLDAAVRAVYVGAVRRRDPAYDAAQDWAFVATTAYDHPREAAASALADRAALGIAADDARHRGRFARLEDGAAFTGAWSRATDDSGDDQRLAAALATAEAFLDAGADEPSGTLLPVEDVRQLADRAAEQRQIRVLAAFAQVVLARTELRAGLGASRFEQAERLVRAGRPGPAAGRLAAAALGQGPDPAAVAARHDRRAAYRSVAWHPAPDGSTKHSSGDDIEHERLASAVLLRLLADGPVDSAKVRRARQGGAETSAAHRTVSGARRDAAASGERHPGLGGARRTGRGQGAGRGMGGVQSLGRT